MAFLLKNYEVKKMKAMKMNWKNMILTAAVTLGITLTGCTSAKSGSAQSAQGPEPYKIGAVLDISGNSSSLGVPERDTLELLVEQVNEAGGINGHPIDLMILDNKSDETEAVLAVKKLVENKVLAILGASSSGPSMAMLKTAQAEEIPMISLAAASSIVEPVSERKWVFKTAQSDIVMVRKIASYLQKNNLNKIALLYMNNSYGDGGRKAFAMVAKEMGLEIVKEDKFDASDKDMTPMLTSIKASTAQAVVVWAIPPSASILTKNYRDLGLAIPLIHSHGVGNENFIQLAQGTADGVILPIGKLAVADQIADSDPQKQLLMNYIDDYTKKYNKAPNSFGGYAWDAFNLLVKALKEAGPDRAAIRDELEKIQGFAGISGVFELTPQDHNGLHEDSAVLVEIENGQWKLLEE